MKTARPFDISLTDHEATRKAKRKKLFINASIPSAMVLLFAGWLAIPFCVTALASSYYKSGAYETSGQLLSVLGVSDVFERYKLPYNQALSLTQAKQYDKIDDLYTSAVALAPENEKCSIYIDYVLSIERRADSLNQANKIPLAIIEYTKAIAIIMQQKECFRVSPETEPRVREKLQAANEALARQQSRYKNETQAEQKQNTSPPSESDQKKLSDIEAKGRQRYNTGKRWGSQRPPASNYGGQKW